MADVRGIAVTKNGRVQYAERIVVACGGRAVEAKRIAVACGGVVRVIWPPTENLDPDDPAKIVLTAGTITPYDIQQSPADAEAWVEYDNPSGDLRWRQGPVNAASERALTTVAQLGEYLVRLDSADGLTGPLNQWLDPADPAGPVPRWALLRTDDAGGTDTATGTFRIAVNDGIGNPLAGSEKTKTVNFSAEVYDYSAEGFLWTTDPWVLEDYAEGEPAVVRVRASYLVYLGQGLVQGYEAGVKVEEQFYANPANQAETIEMVAVSGDTGQIAGDLLNTPIALNYVANPTAEWTLTAANDQDTWEADVLLKITDGAGGFVSKPVKLIVKRDDVATISVLTPESGPFAIAATDPDQVEARVVVRADGTIWFTDQNGNQQGQDPTGTNPDAFPKDYLDTAPTPPDIGSFEVRLVVLSGQAPNGVGSPTPGAWISCADAPAWALILTDSPTNPPAYQFTWRLDFRKKGSVFVAGTSTELRGTISIEPGGETPTDPGGDGPPPIPV